MASGPRPVAAAPYPLHTIYPSTVWESHWGLPLYFRMRNLPPEVTEKLRMRCAKAGTKHVCRLEGVGYRSNQGSAVSREPSRVSGNSVLPLMGRGFPAWPWER